MTNYRFAHQAVTLASARYLKRMDDAMKELEDKDVTAGEALQVTYMKGLHDMAALYLMTSRGMGMKEQIEYIDGCIDSYKE